MSDLQDASIRTLIDSYVLNYEISGDDSLAVIFDRDGKKYKVTVEEL